ncbi:hypothetical protein [Methylobacterium sp. E-046]|uniref:hypothetical protein n=1 Tax=Methylobacterium sp. E-046 TaxID=2836576 RepID=UPI001FBA47EC|nr:hypothetical protein [Methylobacterium sp. E-046]MCJ2102418.1 hypothetical protein [Methylobacterium sp. E-046]
MAALTPDKLAELAPRLLAMLGSREAELTQNIALLGELSGIAGAADLAEGERLIAQGCELVRQAIARAAAQGSSSA